MEAERFYPIKVQVRLKESQYNSELDRWFITIRGRQQHVTRQVVQWQCMDLSEAASGFLMEELESFTISWAGENANKRMSPWTPFDPAVASRASVEEPNGFTAKSWMREQEDEFFEHHRKRGEELLIEMNRRDIREPNPMSEWGVHPTQQAEFDRFQKEYNQKLSELMAQNKVPHAKEVDPVMKYGSNAYIMPTIMPLKKPSNTSNSTIPVQATGTNPKE